MRSRSSRSSLYTESLSLITGMVACAEKTGGKALCRRSPVGNREPGVRVRRRGCAGCRSAPGRIRGGMDAVARDGRGLGRRTVARGPASARHPAGSGSAGGIGRPGRIRQSPLRAVAGPGPARPAPGGGCGGRGRGGAADGPRRLCGAAVGRRSRTRGPHRQAAHPAPLRPGVPGAGRPGGGTAAPGLPPQGSGRPRRDGPRRGRPRAGDPDRRPVGRGEELPPACPAGARGPARPPHPVRAPPAPVAR